MPSLTISPAPFHGGVLSYHRRKVTASVSARPGQVADDIKHLELELWGRERRKEKDEKKKSKRGNGVVVFDTPYPDSPENKHAKTADCSGSSAAVAYQMEREDPLAVAGVSTASWLNDAMV